MSIDDVEFIHSRVRQELERLGLTQAEAARRMGEPDSQGVRDVCAGRKRVTAEFLAKLVVIQVDVLFVLTGRRTPATAVSEDAETRTTLMLQSRGIFPDGRGGGQLTLSGLALLLDYVLEVKGTRPVTLTEKVLAKVAKFAPSDVRPWRLQPVALVPREGGPQSHTLLVYRVKTPVSLVWQLGPFRDQIPPRIELTGWPDFPIKVRADEDDTEDRWELDLSSDGSFKVLDAGNTLSAELVTLDQAQREASLVMASVSPRTANIHIGGDVGQSIAGDASFNAPVSFGTPKRSK